MSAANPTPSGGGVSRWLPSPRLSLALLIVLALIGGVFFGEDQRERTATTFGRVPQGFGALYDLLTELRLPVRRSFAGTSTLPAPATVWWIEPFDLCGPDESKPVPPGRGLRGWDGDRWIRRGGTAVIFLPAPSTPCSSIAGEALPGRSAAATSEPPEPRRSAKSEKWWQFRLERLLPPPTRRRVEGPLVPAPRGIESDRPARFDEAGTWSAVALVDGKPFALEKQIGAGRLVVFADARFLSNAWLAHLDAAPLALDIVRAYGVPLFDERSHGFLEHQGTLAFLLSSPAAAVFAALVVFGLLFAAHGALLPPRSIGDFDLAAPTLETFVDSLAVLYSRTRDHARVFERYRELTLRRLRRHFGLPPETPAHVVVERLRASRRADPQAAAVLAGGELPAGGAALRQAAARLDAAVWEAARSA